MKTISRKDLVLMSAAVFAAHNVSTLFATSDGQFFLHPNRAKVHATSHPVKLTVYEIDAHEAKALEAQPEEKAAGNPKPAIETKSKPKAKAKSKAPVKAELKKETEAKAPAKDEAKEVKVIPVKAEGVKAPAADETNEPKK